MPAKDNKGLLGRDVKDIILTKDMSVKELIDSMQGIGGFSAQHMVDGIHIVSEMLSGQGLLQLPLLPGRHRLDGPARPARPFGQVL